MSDEIVGQKKTHTTNKHKKPADTHLVTVNFNFVTLIEQLTSFTDVLKMWVLSCP